MQPKFNYQLRGDTSFFRHDLAELLPVLRKFVRTESRRVLPRKVSKRLRRRIPALPPLGAETLSRVDPGSGDFIEVHRWTIDFCERNAHGSERLPIERIRTLLECLRLYRRGCVLVQKADALQRQSAQASN